MSFHVTLLTLFPEMFPGPLGHSLAGKALEEGKWSLDTLNIRDFATDKHQTVDDAPYGGGAGMVMRADVIANAIDSLENPGKLVYMSPRGSLLTQQKTQDLLEKKQLTILCGRYEGIDQRVIDAYGMEEISVGDYILSGGEVAAISLIDACVRQITGVIGNAATLHEESFSVGDYENLLEYPLFTRPAIWRDRKVPEVLVSGNHQAVDAWRYQQAEQITQERRKDLWKKHLQNKQEE